MSVSDCAGLARKYRQHWNRKLLSLLGSVPLKVSGMWALVLLEIVLGLGVWLELSVLASQLSTLANCSLVLLLQWGLDCEQVEDVGLLVILLLVLGLAGASSQLGSLSAGWTQRWADLWNDLGFSLCAVPSVCHVVATSDDGNKFKMEVSADWCVAVEYRRSSSIKVIFVDYQTSEL